MTRFNIAALGIAMIFAAPAGAHHSAVQFDFAKTGTQTGLIKRLEVLNPHMTMQLEVEDAKGKRTIIYEGHSRNNWYRSGWRPGMVKAGEKVSVSFAPMRDGTDGGFITGFTPPSGKTINFKLTE
jgi:hypothetical protein